MNGVIIFVVCFIGYPLIAIGFFHLIKAVMVNDEYKDITKDEAKENFDRYKYQGLSHAEKRLRFHKDAYLDAEDEVEQTQFYQIGLVLCVFFWPVMVPLLIVFYIIRMLIKLIPTTSGLNPAKRRIAKLEEAVILEQAREIAWKTTIKNAKALGIDVTELEKL